MYLKYGLCLFEINESTHIHQYMCTNAYICFMYDNSKPQISQVYLMDKHMNWHLYNRM